MKTNLKLALYIAKHSLIVLAIFWTCLALAFIIAYIAYINGLHLRIKGIEIFWMLLVLGPCLVVGGLSATMYFDYIFGIEDDGKIKEFKKTIGA